MLTGVLTTMIIMKQGYQAGFLKIKEGLDWTYGGTVNTAKKLSWVGSIWWYRWRVKRKSINPMVFGKIRF